MTTSYTDFKSEIQNVITLLNTNFEQFIMDNDFIHDKIIIERETVLKNIINDNLDGLVDAPLQFTLLINKTDKEYKMIFQALDLYTFIIFFGYNIAYNDIKDLTSVELEDIGTFYEYNGKFGFTKA